ncbi:MAG: hypothetical protein A7316_10155 [Candidatus Altiarchaeales archaeon WOR_SM1_86-2]|nr:MAG: hypothetical protein A7316_10155 [Candidatus Altiarchaeales archaeon WOR_SM1_86-2]
MVSFIAVGILLYTLPFSIIAVHALREYLKDKEDSKKKHVFYAFASWSVGFTLDLIGALLVAPEMSPARIMVINVLFRLFDAFNVIGLFWLFIFLKDFMPQLKKYITHPCLPVNYVDRDFCNPCRVSPDNRDGIHNRQGRNPQFCDNILLVPLLGSDCIPVLELFKVNDP